MSPLTVSFTKQTEPSDDQSNYIISCKYDFQQPIKIGCLIHLRQLLGFPFAITIFDFCVSKLTFLRYGKVLTINNYTNQKKLQKTEVTKNRTVKKFTENV